MTTVAMILTSVTIGYILGMMLSEAIRKQDELWMRRYELKLWQMTDSAAVVLKLVSARREKGCKGDPDEEAGWDLADCLCGR